MTKKLNIISLIAICTGALFFRVYYINFGLPHSFYADEPEFTELAIKYAYQAKEIIKNNNYYELIPISYVYGTFPVYFLTAALMLFSKILNLLNIGFDKATIFIFFRILMAAISLGVIYLTALIAKKSFNLGENNRSFLGFFTLSVVFLAGLNYKFIVHAHYVNADLILTFLLLLSFYFAYLYSQNASNKNLILMGTIFGFAVGTKITALISLPLFLFLIIKKRDIVGIAGFIFSTLFTFILSNPFSFIFFGDFSYRIFSMLSKEGGIVFDSVDSSPIKYIFALIDMTTWPILLLSFFGIYASIKKSNDNYFNLFLISNVFFYLIFFSLQSRRVDRWLLPIVPIVLIYGAYGFTELLNKLNSKVIKLIFVTFVVGIYMFNPILLLTQFQRWTPKSAAYLWANSNLPETATKLVYTEEGLDPMNKLGFVNVKQFNVYESEGAALFYPEDPYKFDYVIISSRPMENFKRKEVANKYNYYSQAWEQFEKTIEDSSKFELIKDFTVTKPNLIPLSDVFIYKQIKK